MRSKRKATLRLHRQLVEYFLMTAEGRSFGRSFAANSAISRVSISQRPGSFGFCMVQSPHPQKKTLYETQVSWAAAAASPGDVSDGVNAFTGILLEILAGSEEYLLIDEPEAFLHPPLAFKLGSEIAKNAGKNNKQVFVSTHSANFIMGAIQAGAKVDIVRLNYKDRIGTAKHLPSAELRKIMRDPFLRSANVLSGLFFEGVVATEADADRALYQEVNDRLVELGRGAAGSLFVNANGKDTIHRVMAPLRSLGVPAVGIVDLDFLNPETTSFGHTLKAAGVPEALIEAFRMLRTRVWQELKAKGDPKKDGLALLEGGEAETAVNLINQLSEYGLFIVPSGELEQWLQTLSGGASKGKNWLPTVFDAMGGDPESPGYVRPSDGGIWEFVDRVGQWIADPKRKGM